MDPLVVILIALLSSAFFSGMEIAFLSANRLQIELEGKKKSFPYSFLSVLIKNPARFISTMLVGNNVALVVYGLYTPEILDPIFPFVTNKYILLLVQTLVSTVVVLFLAEYIPKAFFNARANDSLKIFAVPLILIYGLFYPLVSLMTLISNGILKIIFKVELSEDQAVFNKVDLDHFIEEQTGATDPDEVDHEIEIFRNALEFSEIKAREFMVPRTDIVAFDVEDGVSELHAKFMESGYSKIVIYNENIDKVIGYVHAFELFKKPENIRSVLRPVAFIPETMNANEVLNLFTREKKSLAIVIDEFGGTAGMITLEDVVEEIFGDIDDEHDTDEFIEMKEGENAFRFSSRLEMDYLNTTYKLDLPESDVYTTLGGMLVDKLERIPEKGEQCILYGWQFTVLEVSSNRIEEVRMVKIDD